jgi:DedD protein
MDKALKQRLVGASVLVALAVIVLPMLLGGASDPQQDSRPIDLPPKPRELAFDTRRFPVGDQDPEAPSELLQQTDEPAQADSVVTQIPAMDEAANPLTEEANPQSSSVEPMPGLDDSAALQEPVPAENAGIDTSVTEITPQAEPVQTPQAPPAEGRYLVQVASFSSTANANRLSEQLRQAGLSVLLDTVDGTAGRLHRVRVGPYDDQAAADAAVGRVKAEASDINPRVIDLRPDESAPVSQPSDPLVRWVVQVGSFGDAENAESLVFKLRDAGFAASAQREDGAGGVAHKVRVGPVVDRQDAVNLAERIRTELGMDGLVMSAE